MVEVLGRIVGGESVVEVGEGLDMGVGFMDLCELLGGLGFSDGVLDKPVEAGFKGLTDVAVDDGASDAKCASELGNVAMLEVGLTLEVGNDGEVSFSIF